MHADRHDFQGISMSRSRRSNCGRGCRHKIRTRGLSFGEPRSQLTFLRFVGTGLSGLALWLFGGDIPEGGMEPLTIVVSFLAVQFVDGRQ
jgi:hypothetical protein